jgi:hypothetical protein
MTDSVKTVAPPQIVNEETNDLFNELFSYGETSVENEEPKQEESEVWIFTSRTTWGNVTLSN